MKKLYDKTGKQARKLWQTINEIPAEQFLLVGQHWRLRHREVMPSQLELREQVQKLAIALNDAAEDSEPANKEGGRPPKLENQYLLDALDKSFTRLFPQYAVSRSPESYFLRAFQYILDDDNNDMSVADKGDLVRRYKGTTKKKN